MQLDGNLVVYDSTHSPVWASNTSGNPGAWLILQNNGNLILYSKGNPIWSTNTQQNHDSTPSVVAISTAVAQSTNSVSTVDAVAEVAAVEAAVEMTTAATLVEVAAEAVVVLT